MIKDTITIVNPTGLHTRPAKRVVDEAKRFECEITAVLGEKEASLKSLLKIMKLGISEGHVIEITCDGPDEKEALEHMKKYILSLEE